MAEIRKKVPKRRKRSVIDYRTMTVSLLRQRDGDDCCICGEHMTYDEMSIEHLVDFAHGGSHEADNLGLSHLSCNLAKARGYTGRGGAPRRGQCMKGHKFPENLYVSAKGKRYCRVCKNDHAKKQRRKIHG